MSNFIDRVAGWKGDNVVISFGGGELMAGRLVDVGNDFLEIGGPSVGQTEEGPPTLVAFDAVQAVMNESMWEAAKRAAAQATEAPAEVAPERQVYWGEWEEDGREAVAAGFGEALGPEVEILIAGYDADGCCGSAFVLFRDTRDGLLYEVNGSHCSCMGLEEQWDPQIVVLKELEGRNFYCLDDEFRGAVRQLATDLKVVAENGAGGRVLN